MSWLRRGLYPLIGLILAGVVFYGFRPDPVPSDIATIQRGTLQIIVEAEAVTRVRESFVVYAPVAAHMERLPYKPGAHVEPGQLLTALHGLGAVLDARARGHAEASIRAAQAALGQAEAQRAGAAADVEFARNEDQRARRLLARKMIAPEAAEAAATRFRAAEAAFEAAGFARDAARFQREMAEAALSGSEQHESREVRSPVAGQVLRVLRESAGTVAPGEPLLEIGDVAGLEIVADLLSQDAVRVRPGMRVSVERWGGEPLAGRVRAIEPGGFTHISALGVEEQRVNVIIDLDESRERWQTLGDGFRVEVRILIQEVEEAIRVPLAALFRTATLEGDAVFVLDDGKARLRSVVVGARSGLEGEVIEGLQEGDQVVIHPSEKVRDGVAVVQR